jgi:signal transduction histidine kinase
VLGGLLGLALSAQGAVLWRQPGPLLIHESGARADWLQGAVKPQDSTSSSTLYFKFSVDPLSDIAVKQTAPFLAGLVFADRGTERLGVGNGWHPHAYSAFSSSGQGLAKSAALQGAKNEQFIDLNTAFKGSKGGLTEFPRRGVVRTFVVKVQYVPGGDDLVTVWFHPDLTPGNSEFSQLSGQATRFPANASFDELRLVHRGGGEGWRFSDLAVATSFDDFVVPHIWQRAWFLGLAAVIVVGGTGISIRLVERRRARRQLERLERQHALDSERGRIAQDLHDDVGAGLTEVMLMGEAVERAAASQPELKQRAAQMLDRIRLLVGTMDQIVWAVNPEKDTVAALVGYLSNYAQSFLEPGSIRCRLDVPTALPDLALASPVRHGLFLAVKEALNNAVKHSGASEVWLRVNCSAVELRLEVEDNGRGFDVAQAEGTGNGLRNLRRRMEAVGGRTELRSAPGQGTTARFVCPLNSPAPAGH